MVIDRVVIVSGRHRNGQHDGGHGAGVRLAPVVDAQAPWAPQSTPAHGSASASTAAWHQYCTDSNLSLRCAQLTCQTSRPVVLCAWFQRLHQTVSVSFPGTRATKEAGQILHPSAPMRMRMRFQDNSTNSCLWVH